MNAMSNAMSTVGLVGVGKIGLPIADNLIKSGYRVVGYRRSSLAEFEKIGGVPAKSAADVGAAADIVLTCLPSTEALDDVVHGARGLVHVARPGQIVAELGSHPVPTKSDRSRCLAKKAPPLSTARCPVRRAWSLRARLSSISPAIATPARSSSR